MNSFEIKNMGIYNSKIAQPHVKISNNRQVSLFEFELPLENSGISYIDSDSIPITTSLFICAKPNQVRHTRFPFKCSYVHMSVSDKALYDELSALPTFIKIKERGKYEAIFDELQSYSATANRYNEIMERSLILKLIYLLCMENKSNLIVKKYGHAINTAIEFIEKNLSSDLSLENVARQVNFSPIYFHSRFKVATGRTLHEYVEEKRIRESICLMLVTDKTLTEIAYSCGFSSQSYFSYVFKRRMGTTPRNYIKVMNNNYEIL